MPIHLLDQPWALAAAAAVVILGGAVLIRPVLIARAGSVEAARRRWRMVFARAAAAGGPLLAVMLIAAFLDAPGEWTFWLLLLVPLVCGLPLLVVGLRGRRPAHRTCPKCRYDLSATPGLTCPECGRTASTESALFRRRRRWTPAAAGIGLILASGAAPVYVAVKDDTWPDRVPGLLLVVVFPWLADDSTLFQELHTRMKVGAGIPGLVYDGDEPTFWTPLLRSRALAASGMDSKPWVRSLGYETLAALGVNASRTVPVLRARLSSSDATVRRYAMQTLAYIGEQAHEHRLETVHALLPSFVDSDADVAIAARFAVVRICKSVSPGEAGAVPPLMHELWESSPQLRQILLITLPAFIADESWWSIVERGLTDDAAAVRAAGVQTASVHHQNARAAAAIATALADEAPLVRLTAVGVLLGRGSTDANLLEDLRSAVADPGRPPPLVGGLLRAVAQSELRLADKVDVIGAFMKFDHYDYLSIDATLLMDVESAPLIPRAIELATARRDAATGQMQDYWDDHLRALRRIERKLRLPSPE